MNPLILQNRGYGLRLRGNTLDILDNKNNIVESHFMGRVPYSDIIFQEPYGYLTLPVLEFCAAHRVNIQVQNFKGQIISQVLPGNNECHGELHLAQYKSRLNEKIRTQIAKEIIRVKILTQSYVMHYIHDFKTQGLLRTEFIHRAKETNSINSLLNAEARASDAFWESMVRFYEERLPWARFEGRRLYKSIQWKNRISAKSAHDPLNALENYAQWMTEAISRRVCNYIGLDHSIGWIHQIHDEQSKESSVYDLQEMIRWLGTLSVIMLVEQGKIPKQSFIVTDKYNVRLTKDTSKLLIHTISSLMNISVPYKTRRVVYSSARMMTSWTYENIFIDCGTRLARFLLKTTGARFDAKVQLALLREKQRNLKLANTLRLDVPPLPKTIGEKKQLSIAVEGRHVAPLAS